MKNKLFSFIVTLFFTFGLTLSGCSNSESNTTSSDITTSTHEHTYSSLYEYDDTYHWHPSTCGHDVKGNEEKHTFTSVVTEPTYEEGGYTTYTCSVCGYSYVGDETNKLEHNYSNEWTYDELSHWHACTDEGYEHLRKDEEKHTFTSVVTEPTYEEGGYTTYTCSVCGYSYVGDETNKLEHNYSNEWTYDELSHWHACTDEGYEHLRKDEEKHTFTSVVTEPTYEEGGYTTYTCSVCGYSYVEETPHLNSELQALITAINANDYVNSGSYWFGVEGTNFTATDYYTEDYYISSLTNYAGYQGIATYLELKGEEVTPENVSAALGSAVFYKGDDGYVKSRQIILTPITNEEGVTSLTYVIGEESNATTTSGATVTNDLYYQACGYYSSYGVFNETTFSVFSDEREIFFSSLGSTYNSRSYATGELFAQVFGVYEQILKELGGDPAVYATVVDPTIDRQTGACTDVTFYVAFGADTNGSYQLYQFDITGFGEGSDNPLADQLADLL